MQNSNRTRVSLQHIRQSSIRLRRFVQISAPQDNPVVVQPFHHLIVPNQAILSDATPAGSAVVTVGVAELYGAEFEFQEE